GMGDRAGEGSDGALVRGLGIDAVSVVEIRVESAEMGTQVARRQAGTVDSWVLQLTDDESDVWGGDATRIRTVLRGLGSASLAVIDDDEGIGEMFGTLWLVDGGGLTTEVRFGTEAAGGIVRAEVVSRGADGIARSRWFGRIERSLRDLFLVDGFESWRTTELFDFTLSQVFGAEVRAGGDFVGLKRTGEGWGVVEPWSVGADGAMVESMLGLTLGLKVERFYDASVYTDDLTGLVSPMARIRISGRETGFQSGAMIEIGAAVDTAGSEIFARYSVEGANPVLVAIKTAGLNQLTPAPLAYVHQTASEMGQADVGRVRILGTDGIERFVCKAQLDSWEVLGVVVSASQREAIDRLIGVLTQEKAERIYELSDGEESAGTLIGIGEVELVARNGETELFEVSIESGDEGIRLLLSRGIGDGIELVWVCGSAEAGGTGAWIGALVAGGEE
ncbi:MAG: hypothetical protein JKY43_03360, partial [Phycisphaerales bacterium]|nr:hypothetical protein [Phycisphaerales bacterium]